MDTGKLDKIAEDVAEIKTDIALIKKDLAYHIKRTDLLEEIVRFVRDHVTRVDGALKLLGLLALIVSIVGGAVKLFWS